MFKYKTGLGQIWVGTHLPPEYAYNLLWLKPSDQEKGVWELRTYNKHTNKWDLLTAQTSKEDKISVSHDEDSFVWEINQGENVAGVIDISYLAQCATKQELKTTNDRVGYLEQEVFPLNASFTSDKYIIKCRTTTPINLSWEIMHKGTNVTNSCNYKLNGAPLTPTGLSTKSINITAGTGEASFMQTLETTYNTPDPVMTFKTTSNLVVVSVYESFFGVINTDVNINEGNIKQLLTEKLNANRSFSASGLNLNNQHICFAYPKSFGALTSVKDGNNLENIRSYDKKEITLDGVSYYVYTTSTPTTASNITQKYM